MSKKSNIIAGLAGLVMIIGGYCQGAICVKTAGDYYKKGEGVYINAELMQYGIFPKHHSIFLLSGVRIDSKTISNYVMKFPEWDSQQQCFNYDNNMHIEFKIDNQVPIGSANISFSYDKKAKIFKLRNVSKNLVLKDYDINLKIKDETIDLNKKPEPEKAITICGTDDITFILVKKNELNNSDTKLTKI